MVFCWIYPVVFKWGGTGPPLDSTIYPERSQFLQLDEPGPPMPDAGQPATYAPVGWFLAIIFGLPYCFFIFSPPFLIEQLSKFSENEPTSFLY